MSTPESPRLGPCTPWITGADVAAACDALTATDDSAYDTAAQAASKTLFRLSGGQFTGLCGPVTVRPCNPRRACARGVPCGACRASRVKLGGTVRQVLEVLVDGATVDSAGWRVDGRKWLVRLADANGRRQVWPGCQRLDLDTTEERTFAVTYDYGVDPPQTGLDAAVELACQLASFQGAGECELPPGTVRITRQGVEIDLKQAGAWWSVLPATSLFLAATNPQGLRARPRVWSPDVQPYGVRAGE